MWSLFLLFGTRSSEAQNQNLGLDQNFDYVNNLCFDLSYKEVIKINKSLDVSTLTTLDKLTFKQKSYKQKHHRYLSSTSYPVHNIKYITWHNIFPKWYIAADNIKSDETGTTSYFTTKNKYLSNNWFEDLAPESYNGYYGINDRNIGSYYYMMPHTQISLNSYMFEKEIIEKVGFLAFYRYAIPTNTALQEFVGQGFSVSQNSQFIILSRSDIRITWQLNEKVVIREMLTNNTVTKTIVSKFKYYEKFGQYLLSEESEITSEIFENGGCYEIIATTTYDNFDDNCEDDNTTLDTRSKKDVISKLEVFPNPAQDNITVKIPFNDKHISSLDIVDQMGRIVTGTNIASNISSINIDINFLSPGIYFIKLNQGDQYYNSKFIKQ